MGELVRYTLQCDGHDMWCTPPTVDGENASVQIYLAGEIDPLIDAARAYVQQEIDDDPCMDDPECPESPFQKMIEALRALGYQIKPERPFHQPVPLEFCSSSATSTLQIGHIHYANRPETCQMTEQKWEMGTDMGPIEFEVVNDPSKLSDRDRLTWMTIDRSGDRIDLVRLKLEEFEIEIKDGWLHARPKVNA